MPHHGIIPYLIAIFLLTQLSLLIFVLPIAIPLLYLFAVLPTKRHFTNLELQYDTHHRSESSEMTASEAVKAEIGAVPTPNEATGMAYETFKERDDGSNESGGSVTPTIFAEDDPNEDLFSMPIERNVGNTAQGKSTESGGRNGVGVEISHYRSYTFNTLTEHRKGWSEIWMDRCLRSRLIVALEMEMKR